MNVRFGSPRSTASLRGRPLILAAVFAIAPTACDQAAPAPSNQTSKPAESWFTDVSEEIGVGFVHEAGVVGKWLLPEIMGSGVALFDFDVDGDLDIYLVNAHDAPARPLDRGSATNRLYRQEADGRFTDATDASGLGDHRYGMGTAIGDVDNDGFPDVFVTNYGSDRLYRNNGDGTFDDITESAGIHVDGWSCSAAFLDYDRDGDLDLFVTQYVDYAIKDCFDRAGRADYCGPTAFRPVRDLLLRNNGDRTFSDMTSASGLDEVQPAAGLGVACADFNDDGWPDIYVANDAYPNHLWINRHDGTFREEALLRGAAYNAHGQPEAGMGIAVGDLNGDGATDLFVTHLNQESNTLYRNLGAGRGFTDATGASGLAATSMIHTGFGTAAIDAELDGDLDLLVVNGRVVRGDLAESADAPKLLHRFAEPNRIFINDGHARFSPLGEETESFCRRVEVTRGLACGDIDNDGDMDFVVTNTQGPARVYRNNATRNGHWLTLRLIDPMLKRHAIGAGVTLQAGVTRIVRTVGRASSYLSSHDPRVHVGLGAVNAIDRAIVDWPDGTREAFEIKNVDRQIELLKGSGGSQ